jgi:hypothetical protein
VEYKLRRFVNDYITPPKTASKLTIGLSAFARMEREIAVMGARTPHELMRCVEVSFIRDCAEMAANASLMRTESRWGLYHDRADHPHRDDASWLYHLNLRKRSDGQMEFLKRPVTPYFIPVDDFNVDPDAPVHLLGTSNQDAFSGLSGALREPITPLSPLNARTRILEVLTLAEQEPSVSVLEPYLVDSDAQVRATAIATLTETTPAGFGLALVPSPAGDADQFRS